MTKPQYLKIKKTLNNKPSTSVSLGVLGVICCMFYLAIALFQGAWWEYAISQALFAVAFFQSFGLMHEAVHNNASGNKAINNIFGFISGVGCGLPFWSWRDIHRQHHIWVGNIDKDPTAASLKQWEQTGIPQSVKFTWKYWIPLGGFIQHVVFWKYWFKIPPSRIYLMGLLQLNIYLFIWAAGASLFSMLPAFVLYLVATELVNYPHHVGMPQHDNRLPPWEQASVTRSCLYPVGISEFLVLNFNFHTEHHLFPSIPWFRLRAARGVIKYIENNYTEEIGIDWNLKNRKLSIEKVINSHDSSHP